MINQYIFCNTPTHNCLLNLYSNRNTYFGSFVIQVRYDYHLFAVFHTAHCNDLNICVAVFNLPVCINLSISVFIGGFDRPVGFSM